MLEKARLYRKLNKDKVYKLIADWVKANREKSNQIKRKWAEKNKEKDTRCKKEYEAKNPKRRREYTAARRAKKASATPPWLTLAQRKEIRKIYLACPDGHEVDHIVPINGKNVSGLHVPWNLQHLSKEENRAKRNKLLEVA